jgi:hypothetical protein
LTISFITGFAGNIVNGGTHTSTGNANATGANTIIAMASILGPAPNNMPFIFQDSSGNTYSPPAYLLDNNGRLLCWAVAVNATVSASMSVEVFSTGLVSEICILAAAFNITTCPGAVATSIAGLTTGNSLVPLVGPVGRVSCLSLVVGLFVGTSATPGNVFTPGAGFTQSAVFAGAVANPALSIVHQIVNSPGNYTPNVSMSPAANWGALGLTLPDLSTPVTQVQVANFYAALPGIPPNMSTLAAMSAGLLPANTTVTNTSTPILAQLSNGGGVIKPLTTATSAIVSPLTPPPPPVLTPPIYAG